MSYLLHVKALLATLVSLADLEALSRRFPKTSWDPCHRLRALI